MHPKFHDTDVAVITAPNEIITGTRNNFKEYVLKEAGDRHVLIDMNFCNFLDSSAIGTLFALSRELRKTDRRIGLFGLSPDLAILFDLTRSNLLLYLSPERAPTAKTYQELRDFTPSPYVPDPDEPDAEGDGFLRLI